MGERLLCKQEVIGSIPFTSTPGGHPGRAPRGRHEWSPGRGSGARGSEKKRDCRRGGTRGGVLIEG